MEDRHELMRDVMPHTFGKSATGLPEYRVRRSTRARRLRLSVNARDGLVVTLPTGLAEADARRAVAARIGWAERALAAVADRRALVLAGAEAQLPDEVHLLATGRILPVAYRSAAGYDPGSAPDSGIAATADSAPKPRTSARERDGVLVVSGSADPEARLAALRRWRDRTARDVLGSLAADLAAENGLVPARVSVRGQRTRWGSCSARGTVSLNRNLVFCPPHLVRYVLAHELAHLAHLDHSPRFWSLVRSIVPSAEEARSEMRSARSLVPVWADA